MIELYKKIKFLKAKRKLANLILFLSFGGAFVGGHFMSDLYWGAPSFAIFIAGFGFGLFINGKNEKRWKPDHGDLIASLSSEGINSWHNHFLLERKDMWTLIPLIPWKMILDYKEATIENKIVFLIYLDTELFNSHFKTYNLPKGFNQRAHKNILRYNCHIAIEATDVHSWAYRDFIKSFIKYHNHSLTGQSF